MTPRTNPSVGDPTNYDRVIDVLLSTEGGATIDATGRQYRGDGILVALKGPGLKVAPRSVSAIESDGLTFADLVDTWVRASAHLVTAVGASPARYFGAWRDVDTDVLYLDVVEAFSSAEEDRALDAARARGEIAVWHNGRQEEIRV